MMKKSKSVFVENDLLLITPDLNIRRYLGGDKVDTFKVGQMATVSYPNGYGHGPRTHNESIALNTIDKPIVKVKENNKMRIRKLVPCETMKLMGFTREDFQSMRDVGMTDNQIYHCAGDSLVVSLCSMLIGVLLPIHENELKNIVENYIEEVKR